MAKSVLSSDTLPKAGRVNEVCREWLVHEDGALAYRLQDEEIKEHYTGNKTRNAQVREDAPRARVEQELEALRYQNYVQQQEERDALVAQQIAISLEREERQRERELQNLMRLQLRLGDEAMQQDIERRIQEEKDEELARKLQQQEQEDHPDGPEDQQLMLDQKLAMEAQDAELAKMLQDKERAKARKARERARQKKLERERLQQQEQQQQQQFEEQNPMTRPPRPDRLDLKTPPVKNRTRHPVNYSQYPDPEEIQTLDDPVDGSQEVANVAAIIDPTYNMHRGTSSSSSSTISPVYALPTPSQELIDDAPCYMPIQGQRRNQVQSPSNVHEEKHKRRVKDGCKHQ
ncbi:coiled-coil domain-containing protein 50 [Nylanderia fulva]|uniref:coiled-coil domain-containing protein 50 n=1 Tax=Nylanderia fulva TaxID=613905 RepID=UPI0010FB4769|nr:coiled-coil domain-containing protein 50 [Nylanderia fulva]XP_029178669.1 coiled-coil domain-containing protein 50 [Nylanderia fulva]XP_029178670.1 coiled-coil domain-containing protein 50 [Nylanderia fulva]XP_029178672.1 coiled-coil domain-containing protein 50 [Nylanderia fulva]